MSGLSLKGAQEIIEGAIAKANQLGIKITVAVVDGSGHLLQLTRMDGAGWGGIDLLVGKAYTAVAFRADTEMTARWMGADAPQAMAAVEASHGKIVPAKGGLVIKEGNDVIGGIGVGGGRGEEDLECARAGLERYTSSKK